MQLSLVLWCHQELRDSCKHLYLNMLLFAYIKKPRDWHVVSTEGFTSLLIAFVNFNGAKIRINTHIHKSRGVFKHVIIGILTL